MAKTYLLEIGLEEMPAHVVTPSVLQLKERMVKFLKDARLDFEDVKTFSTPRRLTVQVLGLADKQADVKKKFGVQLRRLLRMRMATGQRQRLVFLRAKGRQLMTSSLKMLRVPRMSLYKPLRPVKRRPKCWRPESRMLSPR